MNENLGDALDNDALIDADEEPDAKGAVREGCAGCEFFVEFRVEVGKVLVDIPIEHKAKDGCHRVDGCVANKQPIAVKRVGFEVGSDAIDSLRNRDDEATMDDELSQFG